jgi:hypothetical protein
MRDDADKLSRNLDEGHQHSEMSLFEMLGIQRFDFGGIVLESG